MFSWPSACYGKVLRVLTIGIGATLSKMSKIKPENNTSKDGVVIQRVIREVGSGSGYPALTKANYSDWALLNPNEGQVEGKSSAKGHREGR